MKTKKRKPQPRNQQKSESACRLFQSELYGLLERIHSDVASDTAWINCEEIVLNEETKLYLLNIAKELAEIRVRGSVQEFGRIL